MNAYKKANIIFFSGTGGTEYVAKAIYKSFINIGINPKLMPIGNNKITDNDSDIMVIAYPVYAGDASEAVYQFINNLKSVNDKPLVILSISGGGEVIPNNSARGRVKRKLSCKGYITVYEDMIVMPNNFASPYSDDVNALLIQAADIMADIIAQRLQKGYVFIKKSRISNTIIKTILFPAKLGYRLNGRLFKANKDCNACGLCARICPRDNIIMVDDKPSFKWRCTLCMRCLYSCPKNAIGNRITNLVKIKQGFNIQSMKNNDLDFNKLTKDDIILITRNDGTRKYLLRIYDCIRQ